MSQSIGRLISILHRQSQIYINKALKEFSITSAEYSFILALYRKEGQTQEELSRYVAIDKAATARAIQTLQEKGYVTKVQDERDRRCNHIHLTPLANKNREEIIRRIKAWSTYITEGMDATIIEETYTNLLHMVHTVESKQQEMQ